MKVWISSLVFAALSLAVSSQTCPSAVFVVSLDQTLDEPMLARPDPELSYFKSVLKFRDGAIRHAFEDAIRFFNYTFGLDFSGSPNEQHEVIVENAIMRPFTELHLESIVNSNN